MASVRFMSFSVAECAGFVGYPSLAGRQQRSAGYPLREFSPRRCSQATYEHGVVPSRGVHTLTQLTADGV